jgi:hypothetical protein
MQATYAALAEFGATLQDIRPEEFAKRGSFFRFGRDPRGFDILPDIPRVDFDAAWHRPVEGVIDAKSGLETFFIFGLILWPQNWPSDALKTLPMSTRYARQPKAEPHRPPKKKPAAPNGPN